MGRSVMTHPDAQVTAYVSWAESHDSICTWCDEEIKHDYPDWVLIDNADVPEFCAAHMKWNVEHYGEEGMDESEATHEGHDYDWEDFEGDLEWVSGYMQELWPSLRSTERWPYDEVHVFLESSLVEVSVSEYCGLVALCIAPRSDLYDESHRGLAVRWINSISDRFLRTFGAYSKVGTFSNGESVYLKGDDNAT